MSVRAAIVATLAAVPGIGRVHDRQRYARAEKDFRALYVTGEGVLNGWFVARHSFEERAIGDDSSRIEERWRITGLVGLSDDAASELAFDTLIDAVATSFRADRGLGGAVLTTDADGRTGLQLLQAEPVSFAGVLCHRAILELRTSRHVQAAVAPDEGQLLSIHAGHAPAIGAAYEEAYALVAEAPQP